MQKNFSIAAALAAFALCLTIRPAAAATNCDSECLNGFTKQYLTALVEHNAKKLPLARGFRFTENGVAMDLGDALWITVSGAGPQSTHLYFNDPRAGQAGFLGAMEEGGKPIILFLRLKVQGGKISEAETIVARNEVPGLTKPLQITDKPVFHEVLAPSERRTRAEMINVMKGYFTALVDVKPNDAIFDPNCQRTENGTITANKPDGDKMSKLSCGAQVWTGVSAMLTRAREPRFFVVDEEHGVVGTVFFFDHSASPEDSVAPVTYPDGSKDIIKSSSVFPFSWMAGEVFKIKNGRIQQIEIVIRSVPYRMSAGWPVSSK